VEIRYKHVEQVLSRILGVSPTDAKAFRARLRHLRNIGIPTDLPKTGSGSQIAYTRDQVVEMLIALELAALGMAPRHAVILAREAKFLDVFQAPGDPFIVVCPGTEGLDAHFTHLEDAEIIKVIQKHNRISLVNLASSLRILDDFLGSIPQ